MNTRDFLYNLKTNSNHYSQVLTICKSLLKQNKENLNYLNSRIPKNIQNKFEFGYFPPTNELNLLTDKFDKKILKSLKLISEYNINDSINTTVTDSFFNYHNLIFPVKDDYNHIVGFAGRTLLPKEEMEKLKINKYKNYKFERSLYLFGLDLAKDYIRKSESVIVVEGQFDCISCHRFGFHNVVALSGSSMSDFHFYLLRKYGAKNITLILDNDTAGEKGAKSIIKRFGNIVNIKNLILPSEYKDIDNYLNSGNLSILSEL
jgi:DNA primase